MGTPLKGLIHGQEFKLQAIRNKLFFFNQHYNPWWVLACYKKQIK
jgi:hypothetical protein